MLASGKVVGTDRSGSMDREGLLAPGKVVGTERSGLMDREGLLAPGKVVCLQGLLARGVGSAPIARGRSRWSPLLDPKPDSTGRPGLGHRCSAGFSLLELVIVLVILGLLTSLVLPALGAGLRNWQLRTAAAELVSSLKLARTEAVSTKLVQAVRIDLDHDRVDRMQATMLAVASGELERFAQQQLAEAFGEEPGVIDFAAFGSDERPLTNGPHYVLFFPRGNSTGGRITMRHREDDRALVVDVAPVSGRVTVEKGKKGEL